jgi:hypothetical protein
MSGELAGLLVIGVFAPGILAWMIFSLHKQTGELMERFRSVGMLQIVNARPWISFPFADIVALSLALVWSMFDIAYMILSGYQPVWVNLPTLVFLTSMEVLWLYLFAVFGWTLLALTAVLWFYSRGMFVVIDLDRLPSWLNPCEIGGLKAATYLMNTPFRCLVGLAAIGVLALTQLTAATLFPVYVVGVMVLVALSLLLYVGAAMAFHNMCVNSKCATIRAIGERTDLELNTKVNLVLSVLRVEEWPFPMIKLGEPLLALTLSSLIDYGLRILTMNG